MSLDTVELTGTGTGVSVLSLNRPDRLNTLNRAMVTDLFAALDAIDRDDDCHVVVLTGAGRAFCAGLDLEGYGDDDDVDSLGTVRWMLRRQSELSRLTQRLIALRQPVIAAVNGPATGGGLALALASDVRMAATGAVFGVSFIRAGFSACDLGTSWLLPRIVGVSRAHELMLTGRLFDADEALRIGLVTESADPERLHDRAIAKAVEIRRNPPISVELTKQAMWLSLELPSLHAAIALENRQQIITAMTEDQAEATAAFLEKRDPYYRNR